MLGAELPRSMYCGFYKVLPRTECHVRDGYNMQYQAVEGTEEGAKERRLNLKDSYEVY
jgi:hypothetical protein